MTCVCLGAVQEHMWRSKTTCGESVPFFSLWVPGIKVKSSGLCDKWFPAEPSCLPLLATSCSVQDPNLEKSTTYTWRVSSHLN